MGPTEFCHVRQIIDIMFDFDLINKNKKNLRNLNGKEMKV